MGEADLQSGKNYEQVNFLPPPPASLLTVTSSDTPDLPDPPSDSELSGHKNEVGIELPEPPKEEELRLIESFIIDSSIPE